MSTLNSGKVQSILFDVKKYTPKEARKWLKDHGYVSSKIDTTEKYHRFRQIEPSNEYNYRIIEFGGDGIKAVYGFKQEQKPPSKARRSAKK